MTVRIVPKILPENQPGRSKLIFNLLRPGCYAAFRREGRGGKLDVLDDIMPFYIDQPIIQILLALLIGIASAFAYFLLKCFIYRRFGIPRLQTLGAEGTADLVAATIAMLCGILVLIAIGGGPDCGSRDRWPVLSFGVGVLIPSRYFMNWLTKKLGEQDRWFAELVAQGKNPEELAEALARRRFPLDQPSADIRNFSVKIYDMPDRVRVNLCPKLTEGEPLRFGGERINGREVNYYVDKRIFRITRVTYGR
jgi:hypothetical protein